MPTCDHFDRRRIADYGNGVVKVTCEECGTLVCYGCFETEEQWQRLAISWPEQNQVGQQTVYTWSMSLED